MLSTKIIHQQLQCELDRLRRLYGFPGATVAYGLPSGIVGEIANGFADIETKEPMTTRARMLAASVGKTFVAATVLALDREGRLNLDDPLFLWLGKRSWYSRLPNHNTITLRHLLTHSSGLSDHVYTRGFQQSFIARGSLAPESLISYILDQPPLFEAGTSWAYTDTGYILLGLVVETVTGNRYYEEVMRRFLVPIKLNMTTPSDRRLLPGLVAGYTTKENVLSSPRKTVDASGLMVWNPAIEWTGGGLISTSRDLAVWSKVLYEGRAMVCEYVSDLLRSVSVGDGTHTRYGAGVLIHQDHQFGQQLGHGGVAPGYCSSMRYYSKYAISVAFQINTDAHVSDWVGDMEHTLAEIVIQLVEDSPAPHLHNASEK
jgi:D-alanyl-D-alanine carboxypeptidase